MEGFRKDISSKGQQGMAFWKFAESKTINWIELENLICYVNEICNLFTIKKALIEILSAHFGT